MTEEDEAFEESVVTVHSNVRHSKKILKTRRLTDTQVGYDWRTISVPATSNEHSAEAASPTTTGDFENNPNVERIIINEDTINKIVVPTASSSGPIAVVGLELEGNVAESQLSEGPARKEKREARSVFVKTKRIVFSPFRREGKNKSAELGNESSNAEKSSPRRDESSAEASQPESSSIACFDSREADKSNGDSNEPPRDTDSPDTESKRPPLPKSPILSRKEYRLSSPKETAPSIRMMIRRYNAKLDSETDRYPISSSANSSGSGGSSPNWRTPISERRLFARMERYDEAKKAIGSRKACCRSCDNTCDHTTVLTKSSSADFSRHTSRTDRTDGVSTSTRKRSPSAQSDESKFSEIGNDFVSPSSVRAMKIRRAKEDFLSRGSPRDESSSSDRKIESCDRLEKSEDNEVEAKGQKAEEVANDLSTAVKLDLVKSASAGMINVDADTYERLAAAAAAASRGCDSLPRSNEHLRHRAETKEGIGRLSQIASKFRRARLRRAKEKETSSLSTISMLCRQSLLVDIANDSSADGSDLSGNGDKSSTSDQTTPGSSRRTRNDDQPKDRQA